MKIRALLLGLLITPAFADPLVGVGTAVNGTDGADLSPTLHASTGVGDLILCAAGQPSGSAAPTATGYTVLANVGTRAQLSLLARIATGSGDAPSVVFSDNTAGRSTIAQCATFRQTLPSLSSIVHTSNTANNAAAQDVTTPALTITQPNTLLVVAALKERSWDSTDISPLSGMTELGQPERTTTQTEALVWDYGQQTTAANLSASAFSVPSGGTAEGVSVAVSLFATVSGRQYVTLASVDASSWCADFNVTQSPDIAAGDIVSIVSTTSPGGHALNIDTACNTNYGGSDPSRQLTQYDVFDTSASGWMSGGPGNLWWNNQGPVPPNGLITYVVPYNSPMTPTDLSTVCTDPENDAITVTNVDALPTGIVIDGSGCTPSSNSCMHGTATGKGLTQDVELACTDSTGDTTVWQ